MQRAVWPWEHTRKEDAARPHWGEARRKAPMDITRNWRLKTTRSRLLATRDPYTGAVMLPQHTASAVMVAQDVYRFEALSLQPQAEDAYERVR